MWKSSLYSQTRQHRPSMQPQYPPNSEYPNGPVGQNPNSPNRTFSIDGPFSKIDVCFYFFYFVNIFFRYRPSYNVSPGANLPVVRRGGGTEGEEAIVHCMKWGLVPSFTKKSEKPDHYKMV